EILAFFQIPDADLLAVTAVDRNGVSHEPAALFHAIVAHGHSSIWAPAVGVQNHLRLTAEAPLAVEHRLVLEAAVLCKKDPGTGPAGQLGPGIVPKLLQAGLDGRTGVLPWQKRFG